MKATTEPRLSTIGGIRLGSPFTLAALSGYSDLGMRMTCRALGACMTRHEVILDQFVLNDGGGARSGRHLDPADRPIAVQLMGALPGPMAQSARQMVPLGYDMVDINFGCPVRKVLGRCRGGFLLSDPETAIDIVRQVRDAVTTPVTVKMRRAMDDQPASIDRFWQILDALVAIGIDAVTVHGRTVRQKYEGPADWRILTEVKQRHPQLYLFGSGDLFTAEDCIAMLATTGCDGVTIARGAIENPWIFRECIALWGGQPKPAPPAVDEQADLFDRQYRYCIEQYGAEKASRQMRKFGIKRAHLHPEAEALRAAFINLNQPADWVQIRQQFYGDQRSTCTQV